MAAFSLVFAASNQQLEYIFLSMRANDALYMSLLVPLTLGLCIQADLQATNSPHLKSLKTLEFTLLNT